MVCNKTAVDCSSAVLSFCLIGNVKFHLQREFSYWITLFYIYCKRNIVNRCGIINFAVIKLETIHICHTNEESVF